MVYRPQLAAAKPDAGPLATLLERRKERFDNLRRISDDIKVKNTFIDGFSDEEEGGVAMVGCKSCPVAAWTKAPDEDEVPESQSAPVSLIQQAPAMLRLQEDAARSAQEDQSPTPPAKPSEGSMPEPPPALRERQPEVSLGASLHGTGQCRPCGWFWKLEGCVQGAACRHCHLCPEGELKTRKKAKLAILRARNPTSGSRSWQ